MFASLANEGFAAPYNARDVFLVLRNTSSGQYFTAKLTNDPRLWLAGAQNYTISSTVNISTALVAGQYALSLHLADPSPSLRNRPEYAIRTANANLWRTTSGWNDLAHTITVTNIVSNANAMVDLSDEAVELVESGTLPEADDPLIVAIEEDTEEDTEGRSSIFLPLVTN